MKWWDWMPWILSIFWWMVFWMLSFTPAFCIFSPYQLVFSSLLSAIRLVSSSFCRWWYFSQQSWFHLGIYAVQHIEWSFLHTSSITRVTMYTLSCSFPNFKSFSCSMSDSNCHFLTYIQTLRRQVMWSATPQSLKNFPQFVVVHTVKGFSIVSEADVDVFLESAWFLYDPMDVGNLISGSSNQFVHLEVFSSCSVEA